jgi:hypothetical protein
MSSDTALGELDKEFVTDAPSRHQALGLRGIAGKRFSLLAMTIVGCVTLQASDAAACSCSPKSIPGGDHMRSLTPVIFTGIARAARMVGDKEVETTFEVTEAFQGTIVGRRVVVRHQVASPGSCGVAFSVGGTHTLAAQSSNSTSVLSANLCTVWMFTVEGGEQLIDQLRRGHP